ncbi:MAG: tRNA (guanosine(37)-N1)-methyltransferase TrmD [Holosporaceae bacterium]|jgi:tRNA (guanine37-N1)-methyltransferase|nr:tRNA (guanosine(37)-N1)-methyltransferase TrmD [Holosporaceae bacterium]
MAPVWQANVFTIFPEAFPGSLGVSLCGKALLQGIWKLNLIDLKKFPAKSDRIDFPPYGGGAGMVLATQVFADAFTQLDDMERNMRRFYFSPRGRQLTHKDLLELSRFDGISMLCGRYEGVDQRILDLYEMEEISLGDFVLLGGEVAAMAIIEGCVRLLPNIVGDETSLLEDSFHDNLLEHDHYTKPEQYQGWSVPEVLLSGNHKEIAQFRLNQSKQLTMRRRPDLWGKYVSEKMLRTNDHEKKGKT